MSMEDPKHGFRGMEASAPPPAIPAGLTLCISRESGARGGSIGRRVANALGWQVYDSEMVLHAAQQADLLSEMNRENRERATTWIQSQLDRLLGERNLKNPASFTELARPILSLASMGNVVLIGRGAGFILPRETTLHVRMTSPWDARVAYLSQWYRLTREEAQHRAQQLDTQREQYLTQQLGVDPRAVASYDLILCTSRLGEECCAQMIQLAIRSLTQHRWGENNGDHEIHPV